LFLCETGRCSVRDSSGVSDDARGRQAFSDILPRIIPIHPDASPKRQRCDLTFAPGQRPGLYRQPNESPEGACQPMPQPRIGIGTPFQGLWNAVAFPRALPRAKVGTPLRGLGCRMHRSKRQSKSAVVDFDINSAHRVSPRNDEAKRINRKAHPIGKLINRKTHQSIGASIDRRINGAFSGVCGSAHARRSRPVSRHRGRHRANAVPPKTAENVRRNVRQQSRSSTV
jgi:hypothetical protein